ncbi:hypothetical protein HPB48_017937 [Haemaphysalis longicornis]|uniref:Uncharacterized protein n=1 Tax=Haemaphysalis longicornis TaxID=44386 RepID=A0A9J6H558_HAELO|nr:hypothetical protein HPB48_017937 [Haemaphysalis longicornis]
MQARPEVFATFEVLTLIGVALYVHQTPRPSKWPLRLHCSSLDCFNLQAELHGSMDLGTDPCDDFYQYVCGHWAEKHGSFEDQFRYLEVSPVLPPHLGSPGAGLRRASSFLQSRFIPLRGTPFYHRAFFLLFLLSTGQDSFSD